MCSNGQISVQHSFKSPNSRNFSNIAGISNRSGLGQTSCFVMLSTFLLKTISPSLNLLRLLSIHHFRALCLRNLKNPDIRQYFEDRYDKLSEGMRRMVREPGLNKVAA